LVPDGTAVKRGAILSLIVTVVDGGEALVRFLHCMTSQRDAPQLEIIVPFDDSVSAVAALNEEFPEVKFLAMGRVETSRNIDTAAGQHELYDRRRAVGLSAASGDLIAILEDRGTPRPDWANCLVRLHKDGPAVIGGAIECAPRDLLGWSIYVCDFTRYALPFEGAFVDWVSDVNVSYKRSALESTRDLWQERFSEPVVHWKLMEAGEQLYLSPELVVDHYRTATPLGDLLRERFHWGRLFGQIRAKRLTASKRILYCLAAPLVPFILLVRHGMAHYRKGNIKRYLTALPFTFMLLLAWTAGETWGNVTNRA
jgi:hypothetical protein